MSVPNITSTLRIAVVQFNPKIGQVQANIQRARELVYHKISPRSVDLLCFPEMAFTGYAFENAASILPHLEQPRTGPTSTFCFELARRLNCYVVAGYPERLQPEEVEGDTMNELDDTSKYSSSSTTAVGANSAAFYGPNGEWIGGYRKTNLFETDRTWAKAGTGFANFQLPYPLRNVTLGICMDLNPQPPAEWTSVEGPYEIAQFCLDKKSNLLVLLDAWLYSNEGPDVEHDWASLRYWAERLRPLWSSGQNPKLDSDEAAVNTIKHNFDGETIVVVCNRTGEENGKTFAGSSAIYSMRKGSGKPKLIDMMERDDEDVRIWDISL